MRGARTVVMLRSIAVGLLMIVWCVGLQPPLDEPDPEMPPVRSPASCAMATWPIPGSFDRQLYGIAGNAQLSAQDRAAIAKDDLAALRYLIRAARREGAQPALILPSRSRPLLHVLNGLMGFDDRSTLPAGYLKSLYDGYGSQAVLAIALATEASQPHPVLANLLAANDDVRPALNHLQTCADLTKLPLEQQCRGPVAQTIRPRLSNYVLSWPADPQRLPGCETDRALADRLVAKQSKLREEMPDWADCEARLATYFAQRGDGPADIRPRTGNLWLRGAWGAWTFEHAILALSPSVEVEAPRPPGQVVTCQCPLFQPVLIDAFPDMGPPQPRPPPVVRAPKERADGCGVAW
jgi:hypothetical protein